MHTDPGLGPLIDRIISTHHAYLRRSLPALQGLVDRSGARRSLRRLLDQFLAELEEHLFREEQILFPALRELERDRRGLPLDQAVLQMTQEHERVRELLTRLRAEADSPELVAALQGVEEDVLIHLALEEEVLFPRAQALLGEAC